MSDSSTPSYASTGFPLSPGKGHGVRVPKGAAPATATGQVVDPFQRKPEAAGPPKTLSELKRQRKAAMRADPSFDIDGDGVVDQKDFFYATRFDTSGDGRLNDTERRAARDLMRSGYADNFVFVKGGPAQTAAHRVMQRDGAVISEELEGGWAALTRARKGVVEQIREASGGVAGGGGGGAALVNATGSAGLVKTHVEVDMDDSDNVALKHTKGVVHDYDNISVKPAFRPALVQSGVTSLAGLKHKRRMDMRADPSYDIDGDGVVDQRDYFLASRFDTSEDGKLSNEERIAARKLMRTGFADQFLFMKTSGPSDAYHRVMQKDGAIMSEETESGWAALTQARKQGSKVRVGADGNLHKEDEGDAAADIAEVAGSGKAGIDDLLLDQSGVVALKHTKGAVIDFDTTSIKPAYRPELAKSGSTTLTQLKQHRRKDAKPHPSWDLDGDGVVSNADYFYAQRFDTSEDGVLSEEERAAAARAFADGYADQFLTLSSSGGAMTHRIIQAADGRIISEGQGVTNEEPQVYDATKRLGTNGAVPGLDLPTELRRPASGTGALVNRTGEMAGRFVSNTKKKAEGPVLLDSVGVVPGVNRTVIEYPDGRQEAFGGYAGGMGANSNQINMTATMESVMGKRGTFKPQVAGEGAYGTIKSQNEASFSHRAASPHKQAPFALAGEGGVKDVHREDPQLEQQRTMTIEKDIFTRTQLVAARRVRSRAENDGVAGAATGSVQQPDAGATTTTSAAAGLAETLPAYLKTSVMNKEKLPVLLDELDHETIKPGANREEVRTIEATTASALRAARVRDAKLTVLRDTNQPMDSVALPSLSEAHFNDHNSHGHELVSQGQDTLSKTQSQLAKRRLAERVQESMKAAPPEPYGVHRGPLPSYAQRLNPEGQPWWADKAHEETFHSAFAGGPLDSPSALSTMRAPEGHISSGHDEEMDRLDPRYDPALRHTVRDTHAHGQTMLSRSTRGDTQQGLGARTARLIRDGVIREEEEVDAVTGDPFKLRSTNLRQLGSYLRKHVILTEKPSKINPWQIAQSTVDGADTFKPAFDFTKPGGRPLHITHKNANNVRNGLPGPAYDATMWSPVRSAKRWSDAVIEYQLAQEEHVPLDDKGKTTIVDKHEYDPMFSSFSPDRKFTMVGPQRGTRLRPRTQQQQAASDKPPRRNSIYGEPAPLAVEERAATAVGGSTVSGTLSSAQMEEYSANGSQQYGGEQRGPAPPRAKSALQQPTMMSALTAGSLKQAATGSLRSTGVRSGGFR